MNTIRGDRARTESEEGSVRKDWGGRNSVALVYPNSYFLGMSNLGFQTIYGFLNQYDRIVCERVFGGPAEPVSLESGRPLTDFDVIAVSFSYELDYFNLPQILRKSGIPVFAKDREDHHPLIIAGGAAITANPEPMSSIIDCFAIGEAEAILPHMIDILSEGLELPRHQLLNELVRVPGLYIPLLDNAPITRQVADDIKGFPTVSVVLTLGTELSNMYLVEISRGCARGCRFCLAGYHFRPMRYRPADKLLEQAREGLRRQRRIGLVSAAISDHPQIEDLVLGLRRMNADFSVSSIRIKPLPEILLKGLAESGAKTITLAPEAGSQRLRNVICKGITHDDILDAVSRVAKYNFKQIKLYLMIGLPTETESDILSIARIAQEVKRITDRSRSGTQITLNVTPFVPKAGTPFQWMPMAGKTILKKRLSMLNNEVRQKGIEVKSDSIEWSLVQGIISRGDLRLGSVIASTPEVTLAAWREALNRAGINPESIHESIPLNDLLPWERIDSGCSRDRLQKELEKALANGN